MEFVIAKDVDSDEQSLPALDVENSKCITRCDFNVCMN